VPLPAGQTCHARSAAYTSKLLALSYLSPDAPQTLRTASVTSLVSLRHLWPACRLRYRGLCLGCGPVGFGECTDFWRARLLRHVCGARIPLSYCDSCAELPYLPAEMLGTNPLEVRCPFFWPLEQDRARLLSWMPTEGRSGPSAFSLSASSRQRNRLGIFTGVVQPDDPRR